MTQPQQIKMPNGKITGESIKKQCPVLITPAFETCNESACELLQRILTERRGKWTGRGLYKEPAAPKTADLPRIPKGWVWTTLDAIAEIKGGITKDQNRKHTTPARSVPYLRVANVQRGYLDLKEIKEIVATEDEIRELALKPGDVLFNEGGDRDKLGRGWVWNGELPECIHQNHVFRARFSNTGITPKFVSLYANAFGQQFFFDQGKHTTNLASISLTKLKGLPLPLPPAVEQRRIVAEIEKQFTRLDVGVAALHRVQANLKRYRAAVLKAACEGKLVPTEAELARVGRVPSPGVPIFNPDDRSIDKSAGSGDPAHNNCGYEPADQLLQRILVERRKNRKDCGKYKEPAAPEPPTDVALPEGWTWTTMAQLGELNRGKSKHRPRDDHRLYGGPYPFIQTGDIRRSGGTIREHTQTYSHFGLQQSRLWPEGTLCITIAANIAETGILNFSSCFPDSVVGFTHNGHATTTRYVEFFIRTAREKLAQFAPATAQKNINLDVLQKVAIPLPPLAEQTRIVAELERKLSVVEELESIVCANLKRANRLRQSILQQAFSGQLS